MELLAVSGGSCLDGDAGDSGGAVLPQVGGCVVDQELGIGRGSGRDVDARETEGVVGPALNPLLNVEVRISRRHFYNIKIIYESYHYLER